MAPAIELPVLGSAPRERADAARNRRRILQAAERLVAEHGADCVSMDQIAHAAGVGKGTLFRRFGDRATLMRALLDERERGFQESLIRGPAPLGPGAPPVDRLIAFGCGLLDLIEQHGELIAAAEAGTARTAHSVYGVYRAHVTALLREAAPPGLDTDFTADALLAPLRADVVLHLRRERGMELERIHAAWAALVRRLCASDHATDR